MSGCGQDCDLKKNLKEVVSIVLKKSKHRSKKVLAV